jgi:hypothetical protein
MSISLKKALLYREIFLNHHKKPVSRGRAAFVREQVLNSSGRVIRTRTRAINPQGRPQAMIK